MKILMAAPEAVPFIKTGGLADVAGSLCKEYRGMKHEAYSILPLYKKVKDTFTLDDTGLTIKVPVGDKLKSGRIFSYRASSYFIRSDEFFDREELYGPATGDYSDNASRFIFFSRGLIEACRALNFQPDVIHCNDWQTGLVPLYLKTLYKGDKFFRDTATLLTIHNLGYQGLFPASEMPLTNLDKDLFRPEGIEFYDKVNFLKAGIISADILNTVSLTYSREILSSHAGFGLDGVLRNRGKDLFGIINGIDYEEWDPVKDKFLPAHFSNRNLSGRAACKRELIRFLFKEESTGAEQMPLIGIVSRLSAQKGLDLVLQSLPELLSYGVRLVILGKGDESIQDTLVSAAKTYKGKLSVTIGFNDTLAHRIYAGTDFFLMPSKYEPCGLGQMIAMRYGSVPVAMATGGLLDTIQDYEPLTSAGTGFLFYDSTSAALLSALKRAFCVFTEKSKMKKMVNEGMKRDFSWKKSARHYIELYGNAVTKKKA
jgi:starch synthase